MRLFFTYLFLQLKRCAKALTKMLLITAVSLAVVALLVAGMMKILSENKSLTLAKIGVSIPEDEAVTAYVTSFIESMDSVKSICEFEYMDEERAIREFNEGKLQAAVVIPSGFYHDVQVGLNPPAVIYFPEDPGLVGSMFKEVLVSGVSYLQTAEAGVYAAIDTAYTYEAAISIADIGQLLALDYVSQVLARDNVFEETSVSALGEMTLLSYYFVAAVIIIMAFSGIAYSFMYERSSRTVDDKLRINGINRFTGGIARVIAMTPYIFVTGMIVYFAGLYAGSRFEDELVEYNSNVWLFMLLCAFLFAIYFEIVYDLAGRGKTGIFVLVIINVIGICISGLVIPPAYMSDITNKAGNLIPFKHLAGLLSYAFYGIKGGVS